MPGGAFVLAGAAQEGQGLVVKISENADVVGQAPPANERFDGLAAPAPHSGQQQRIVPAVGGRQTGVGGEHPVQVLPGLDRSHV